MESRREELDEVEAGAIAAGKRTRMGPTVESYRVSDRIRRVEEIQTGGGPGSVQKK